MGILAKDAAVLRKAAGVLLGSESPQSPSAAPTKVTVHLVREAFALADADVRQALQGPIEQLRQLGADVRETSLGELCGDARAADLDGWRDTFCTVQWAEIRSSLARWIKAESPQFGPRTVANFELVRTLDRTRVLDAIRRRERFCGQLQAALGAGCLLCIPSAPAIAPLKGAAGLDRLGDYYRRALSLTSLAGIGRLPQVSLPLATAQGAPIGLSLLAARGEDLRLLEFAELL